MFTREELRTPQDYLAAAERECVRWGPAGRRGVVGRCIHLCCEEAGQKVSLASCERLGTARRIALAGRRVRRTWPCRRMPDDQGVLRHCEDRILGWRRF
jgi:hypothetical protein